MDSEIELTSVVPEHYRSAHSLPDHSEGLRQRHATEQEGGDRQEFSLPPADRGKDAWLFLAGCFMIEALVWGFPLSFGLFQEYYSTHEPFAEKPFGIAAIGTTATGIMYLSAPLVFTVLARFPRLCRPASLAGLPLLTASIILASFANSVWQLILTQGALYAVGGAILYCPTILFLDEWFNKRKGLAFGLMWAGTGVSGAAIPFVMGAGLKAYGHRTMLRAWAVAIVALTAPILYFVKPRIPIPSNSRPRPFDMNFLKSPLFWTLQLTNIIQGLGYFLPGIYIPTFAASIGLPEVGGTLALSLFNGATVFGAIGVGWLVDRLHVTIVILIVSVGATIAVLTWGLALSLPVLIIFSILYGLTAGGFSTVWPGIIKETQNLHRGADSGIIFGILGAGRGIGAIASGPLSESLLETRAWLGEGLLAFGSGYGSLIVFTGTTAAATGSLAWCIRRIGWA